MQMGYVNLCHILQTTHLILTKLTVYYIYEKFMHDIICNLHVRNKKILEMLMGGFSLSSMENWNHVNFFIYSDKQIYQIVQWSSLAEQ